MTEISERYRNVAEQLNRRIVAVPSAAWDNDAPCEGWVARDIVRHIVDTSGQFLALAGARPPAGPSVDDDPVGAWDAACDAVLAALEDPVVATFRYDGP